MRSSYRTPLWIAIAALAVVGYVIAAQAGTTALVQQAPVTGAVGSAGVLHFQDFTSAAQSAFGKDTCTRENMDRCEYSCMMPGGILDLYCYEACIYSIC